MEHQSDALGHVVGGLEEIFDGNQRPRIAVKPDMGHARRRYELENTVEKT